MSVPKNLSPTLIRYPQLISSSTLTMLTLMVMYAELIQKLGKLDTNKSFQKSCICDKFCNEKLFETTQILQ